MVEPQHCYVTPNVHSHEHKDIPSTIICDVLRSLSPCALLKSFGQDVSTDSFYVRKYNELNIGQMENITTLFQAHLHQGCNVKRMMADFIAGFLELYNSFAKTFALTLIMICNDYTKIQDYKNSIQSMIMALEMERQLLLESA
jgi:hypothetical protein